MLTYVAACPGYHGDKGGAGSCGGGGGWKNRRHRERDSRVGADDGRE